MFQTSQRPSLPLLFSLCRGGPDGLHNPSIKHAHALFLLRFFLSFDRFLQSPLLPHLLEYHLDLIYLLVLPFSLRFLYPLYLILCLLYLDLRFNLLLLFGLQSKGSKLFSL